MQVVAASEVTDDYLDSTDHIAYQYSNLIQPHALFCNVDRQTRCVLNVSTNVDQWLDCSVAEAIGKILSDDLLPGIENVLQTVEHRPAQSPQLFCKRVHGRDGQPLICRISATTTRWLIELEQEQHPNDCQVATEQLERLLLEQIQTLNGNHSVQEIVTSATCRLRQLLGYERGMCYQFDEENNGEVIVESTAVPGDEKYLWLRFPARDIPRTAREMLTTTSIRTTIDQTRDCHEIFPSCDPETQEYIDLTHLRSRGAAGSCREYYMNLKVQSTFVLPLVVENRLWGLLSFHDQQVRRVSPKYDEYLQSIAKCVSISIERSLRASREQIRQQAVHVVKALSEVNPTNQQWLRFVQSRVGDLKELVPCSGFMLRIGGEVLVDGIVPPSAHRQAFVNDLWQLAQGQPLITHRLDQLSSELTKYAQSAAGAIAIPLSADRVDMAIWLRPEQKHTLKWAGDPMSQIETDVKGGQRLCVRESFEVWTRTTQNSSLPWTEQETSLATSAATQLGLLALSWYASQACQAKTQFLSCMSHEIRTPMTAILGYASLLKEHHCSVDRTDTSSQLCEFVDIIERNSQHLLAVIDDILNLAKIEAGKLTVERIPIILVDLVTDVVALTKVQADIKQLAFDLELATPVPHTISGDPVRLRQILLNLIGNACKFTERGSVTLRIGYQPSSHQITFDVVDTGIGMTESQVGRLFGAFTQADASTTRRFGGSGLGLQISKNLAQLLGGDITVRSQPGVGSTFSLRIESGCSEPVELLRDFARLGSTATSQQTASATTSTAPLDTPSASPSGTLPSLTGMRIMLLEDGVDNQRLLRHLLTKAGAEVTIFENGKLGIESLTTDGQLDSPLRDPFPYDIVLSDMQMPELDGYSTARLLRQKGCERPIIALTAFAMEGNDIECVNAGCNSYLSKPIKRETLIDMCLKFGVR